MSRSKAKVSQPEARHRKDQTIDFLNFLTRRSKSDNVDQYLRTGKVTQIQDLFDCGKYFLTHAMGCGENDFIPNINFKEFACFVPQSENYYPWVFFTVPTTTSDLGEFFDQHGRNYLMSADAGKKDFAIVTNLKSISVFDFNHFQSEFEVSIEELFDALKSGENSTANKNWANFLGTFGTEKVEERKKVRRKEVVKYVEPKEASPNLQYVKRFGHMPSFETPVGYDGKNFRETFKTKELPFLKTESIDWDGVVKSSSSGNRLIWGDNLSVMRALPDDSIDLIYVDPPFFSGRNYNCIFGDDDEVRTFKDIWDGGLPTYLAWLNARIWEMKRILKPTGNLVLHLDKHACHYVKIELDKIFGADNFQNEIIWSYRTGGASKRRFGQKHDNLFWYSKNTDEYYYNCIKERIYYEKPFFNPKVDEEGRYYADILPDDTWDVKAVLNISKERIGYPTQKPEQLLSKIITALSKPGDVVADFFSGGGTTIAVAEKLGRRWLGVDISRIAVSVARDRVSKLYDVDAGIPRLSDKPKTGFSVEYHGVYERDLVREMEESEYRSFILGCYQSSEKSKGSFIHGFKEDRAVYVAPAKKNLRKDQIEEFHSELAELKIKNGVILAWNVSKEAEKYVDDLRRGANGPDIQIIQVRLVDIDSNEFKGDNIRFVNKPAAIIKSSQKNGLTWIFDATASCGTNGSEIHYFQWDFDYRSRFSPHTKPKFQDDADGDGNPLNDYRRIEFTFPNEGKFKIALRIFDKSGAEATHVVEVNVAKTSKRAS
ncbi:MAG: site-specific DNA-methyltransferase [Deltaproteobacteria bacterium]|nr:site-specific DNA-methyltransferase [Deltaproteobacteria bacterium]